MTKAATPEETMKNLDALERDMARWRNDQVDRLAGHLGALRACLEIAVDYADHGHVPSPASVEMWRRTIAASKVRP